MAWYGVSDGQLCYNCMYNVIQHDGHSRGGVVCAFVNKSLDYVTIALPTEFKHLKVLCIDIICAAVKHRYIVVYQTQCNI